MSIQKTVAYQTIIQRAEKMQMPIEDSADLCI